MFSSVIRWSAGIALGLLAIKATAAEPISHEISLNLQVNLVCRADVQSVENGPSGQYLHVTISELCNGGPGYTLTLQHDGAGVRGMTYDNADLVNTRSPSTVLVQRNGAWRGIRVLQIQTDGIQTPVIYGVTVQSKQPRI